MKYQHLILIAIATLAGWSSRAGAQVIDLGSAGNFAVLSGAAVTFVGSGTILGDVGYGTAYTPGGFVVTGSAFTGATATAAQNDFTTAYDAISGQSVTSSGHATFFNQTLAPGVYSAAATLSISGTLTLDGGGDANSLFIFKIGSTLGTASSSQILLTNGARVNNVFWQVDTAATLGASSIFAGNVLANSSYITVGDGASVDGRLLAACRT